jgi:response regulator of citrate/malate metabolism
METLHKPSERSAGSGPPALTAATTREELEAALPGVRRHHLDGIEDYLFVRGDRMSAAEAAGHLGVTERTVCRYRATLRAAGGAS